VLERIVLAASALMWLPYGLYCFARPGALAEIAGVAAQSATGGIELQAMYGGLQAGIGALALAALFRPGLRRPALVALAFLCSGLASARLAGALGHGELSSYTVTGLCFELLSAGFAVALLRRGPAASAA
jgi:hypothetical protein